MIKHYKLITLIGIIILVAGVALVGLISHHDGKHMEGGTAKSSTPLVDGAALAALPHKSASSADTSHLAPNILPPTNMWLSGMVLQKTPKPVFPMPLSFLAKDTGFEIGLPTVSSKTAEIDGPHVPGISASLKATSFQLKRYDKLSATLTYHDGPNPVGALTITEGSPFIFYNALHDSTVTITDINPADISEHDGHYARYTRAGHTYAILSSKGTIRTTANSLILQLQKGDDAAFYALPSSADSLKAYATNPIRSVSVDHQVKGQNEVTTFSYHTVNGKPTAFAAMPYMSSNGHSIADYESIWGVMPTYTGTTFSVQAQSMTPSNQLDLSKLTPDQKQQLIASLSTDIPATKFDQADSYFAGKQLARAANLLVLAQQLGQKDEASKLQTMLTEAFAQHLGNGYFYYDTKLHGIAATHAAFGSEDFNDHHFHYGYWLYAGSILAKYNPSFVSKYGKKLNLLAADIASYQSTSQFPLYRTYDPYAGHSWAAGLAPFADGNNQESSSEAVHAWNGVALWGHATHNGSLQQEGQWMLANESNTAQKAWRTVDTSDSAFKNYASPVASLNFAGKRTYNTFFSDSPTAKLGIQLIPMDPSMISFDNDKDIQDKVQASLQGNNYNVPLGDYALMYFALENPKQAATLAQQQTNIDDGNSKTYMLAWIYSREDTPSK